MEIEQEKLDWLKEIGAGEYEKPVKYMYTFTGCHTDFVLSEEYVRNTPLETMKEHYERNRQMAQKVIDAWKRKRDPLHPFDNDETAPWNGNNLVFQPVQFALDRDCRVPESK